MWTRRRSVTMLIAMLVLAATIGLGAGCGGDDDVLGCPDCPISGDLQWNEDTEVCRHVQTNEVLDDCCCDDVR